jgi:hypothetical protein
MTRSDDDIAREGPEGLWPQSRAAMMPWTDKQKLVEKRGMGDGRRGARGLLGGGGDGRAMPCVVLISR